MGSSKVAKDRLQLFSVGIAIEVVGHVIVDQRPLGIANVAFDHLHLFRHIQAGAALLDHCDDRAQMPFSAFQPGYDLAVTCVTMMFYHTCWLTSPGDTASGTRDNA